MYLILLALPLSCFICLSIFGRFLGARGSALLSVFSAISITLISCFIFYEVALSGCPCQIVMAPFFHSELFDANWGFLFDTLTAVMCVVVTLVSCLVIIFSCSYMIGDPHFIRFLSYLKLFTVAMLILVTADNYIQLFVGWEGVGLSSFLLISFWFTRLQASKAAIQAMLLNRVGDVGLALGVIILFYIFKTTNYQVIFASASIGLDNLIIVGPFSFNLLDAATILLFIGAMGKSGQFGLHAWLPEAMNAPTPVSALLHAATMVTAGVFLLARSSPLLEYTPTASAWVTIIGAITCLFAGTIGLVQNDLKRIIAYSTCSQLGYMVTACGASNYAVSIFHLFNHAFFKALLFLSAGAIIHALANEQDIRRYGGLSKVLVFSYTLILIGSLALIGTPFLTGFYSKDVIIELASARYALSVHFSYLLTTFSVLTTSYYSFRLIFFCFSSAQEYKMFNIFPNVSTLWGKQDLLTQDRIGIFRTNAHRQNIAGAHDPDWVMSLPLIILALGSIFAGFLFKDMFIGLGSDFWNNAIFVLPQNANLIEAEFLPQSIKLIPLFLTIAGLYLAYVIKTRFIHLCYKQIKQYKFFVKLHLFLNRRWLYDKLLNDLIAKPSYNLGFTLVKTFDKGLLELLPVAPLGLGNGLQTLYKKAGQTQSGLIFHYAVVMLLSTVCFLAVLTNNDIFMITDSRIIAIMFLSLIF